MVEQRSPKPLVACSNRVSPAKQKSRGCKASGLFDFYEKGTKCSTCPLFDIPVYAV